MARLYKGLGEQTFTFNCAKEGVGAGDVVKINSWTAKKPDADEDFCGICINKKTNPNYAAIQMHGIVEVKYTGDAISGGYVGLVADGSGGVKQSDSAARKYLVLDMPAQDTMLIYLN